MKRILYISISLLMLASCTKDITRFNEQTKSPATVPPETEFANAVRNMTDGIASPNVNTNVFRFTVQHWAATTYQDEPQYDFTTRAIPQAWWSRMYKDVLADLQDAKTHISASTSLDAAVQKNQLAMADLMQVYVYATLVNSFGDIPYSESLNSDNLFPKYDDAKAIYTDLFSRVDADIAAMSTAAAGFSSSSDFLYKGNVSKWIKFANSLKVRMGMTVADVDDAKAKAAVEAADANAFSSAADNALFQYSVTTPNCNPIWTDLIQSGRQDMVACDTLIKKLQALSDPRLSKFFKPNDAGVYVGGQLGVNNTFSNVAKPSDMVSVANAPALVLDYVEMEFYRAEAKERGYNVAGTAEQHYNNAITASILYWGGTATDATAYLAQPSVAYTTAAGNWKQKIGNQKWIALYNRPVEGWTEVRRLDQPVLNAPVGAKSGFPNRFTYPGNEQQLNPANYKAAAGAIGGDNVETKLFWDKY